MVTVIATGFESKAKEARKSAAKRPVTFLEEKEEEDADDQLFSEALEKAGAQPEKAEAAAPAEADDPFDTIFKIFNNK